MPLYCLDDRDARPVYGEAWGNLVNWAFAEHWLRHGAHRGDSWGRAAPAGRPSPLLGAAASRNFVRGV